MLWGWYRLLVCVHSNPVGALLGNVRSTWCLILTVPFSLCRVGRKLQRIDELCLYFFVLVVLLQLMMHFLAYGMIVTDLNLIWKALPAFWHSHCNLRSSFSSPFFYLFSNISNSLSNRCRIGPLLDTGWSTVWMLHKIRKETRSSFATFKEYYLLSTKG